MELKTKRLKLVPCTKESVMEYVCSLNDTTSRVKNYLDQIENNKNHSKSQIWLVIEKSNGIVIGEVELTKNSCAQGSVNLDFMILSYARNKGYAVEALEKLFNWVFLYGGVQTITSHCLKGDIYSEMILQSLGMTMKKEACSHISWELKKKSVSVSVKGG